MPTKLNARHLIRYDIRDQISSALHLHYGVVFAGFSSCIRKYSQPFLNQIRWNIRNQFSSALHLHYGLVFAGFSSCIRKYSQLF